MRRPLDGRVFRKKVIIAPAVVNLQLYWVETGLRQTGPQASSSDGHLDFAVEPCSTSPMPSADAGRPRPGAGDGEGERG